MPDQLWTTAPQMVHLKQPECASLCSSLVAVKFMLQPVQVNSSIVQMLLAIARNVCWDLNAGYEQAFAAA
ncbi:hypothetical protein JJB98_19345 [Bradyrhizobium diazoefficiens]|nr:hypothetical protein JJB98_19345 [Bradyrhizobium diazoefficiens]